jgi:co-chaperonin GroES (HSP10)
VAAEIVTLKRKITTTDDGMIIGPARAQKSWQAGVVVQGAGGRRKVSPRSAWATP